MFLRVLKGAVALPPPESDSDSGFCESRASWRCAPRVGVARFSLAIHVVLGGTAHPVPTNVSGRALYDWLY